MYRLLYSLPLLLLVEWVILLPWSSCMQLRAGNKVAATTVTKPKQMDRTMYEEAAQSLITRFSLPNKDRLRTVLANVLERYEMDVTEAQRDSLPQKVNEVVAMLKKFQDSYVYNKDRDAVDEYERTAYSMLKGRDVSTNRLFVRILANDLKRGKVKFDTKVPNGLLDEALEMVNSVFEDCGLVAANENDDHDLREEYLQADICAIIDVFSLSVVLAKHPIGSQHLSASEVKSNMEEYTSHNLYAFVRDVTGNLQKPLNDRDDASVGPNDDDYYYSDDDDEYEYEDVQSLAMLLLLARSTHDAGLI